MEIREKVVIVTGGASGLGEHITRELLESGARVVVLDNSKESLDLMEENENLLKLNCDITNESELKTALEQIVSHFKSIHVLINNAGILYSEPLINIMSKEKRHSVDLWQKVIDLNLTAPFLLASHVVEHMVMNRTKGVIINISSISSNGNIGQTAYSAAKAGLIAMTKVWSKELGRFGIRSVAVSPGFMDTGSTHAAISESIVDEMRNKTPLRQLGKSENISTAIKFAIENDYFNGKVLEVDGGLVL